ncbi:MAG: hypothetical protein A2086_16570 [Spirochaetes bacterium GWD1_27_9]|nr:MAG: hypothetical protein A2Z98_12750 [Spirochaetes bacterium GWB1_27_13]OHD29207.1 MAG: hypothetical protein A2086_16570 [Spirochaetes bacterium GWD1_27_9]
MTNKLFLIVLFSIAVGIIANANSISFQPKDEVKFSFVSKTSDFTDFGSKKIDLFASKNKGNKNYKSLSKSMLGMGIAGTIVMILGLGMTIGGGVCLAFAYKSVTTFTWTGLGDAIYLVYGGAALITLGMLLFWVGLPLMIAGFAASAYYKSKASSFINSTDKDVSMGIKIRF